MRKLALVLVVLGVIGPFALIFEAQELPNGWSGTRTLNGTVEKITFELKQISDPHARWRLGTGIFAEGTIIAGQNKLPLKDFRLDGDSLSYVATQQNGVQQEC